MRDGNMLSRTFLHAEHWTLLFAEGRIEPSDGTLMCSYHGWRFDGEGKCTDVPQSLDVKANAAACTNTRSCAVSRPVQVGEKLLPCPDQPLWVPRL